MDFEISKRERLKNFYNTIKRFLILSHNKEYHELIIKELKKIDWEYIGELLDGRLKMCNKISTMCILGKGQDEKFHQYKKDYLHINNATIKGTLLKEIYTYNYYIEGNECETGWEYYILTNGYLMQSSYCKVRTPLMKINKLDSTFVLLEYYPLEEDIKDSSAIEDFLIDLLSGV